MTRQSEDLHDQNWFTLWNPLLDKLPKFNDPDDLIAQLAFNPLQGIDPKSLSVMERHSLLVGEKSPLEPTIQSLRAAMTWLGMLQTGLRVRNPVVAENRARYWKQLVELEAGKEPTFQLVSGYPTEGISSHTVAGPAGTGKTITAKRFCQMLPQLIHHGPTPAAGWESMNQLVWLYVELSHDGSRGGFLLQILMEMDKVLGTQYAQNLPRQFRTIEKLAVATIGRLVAHYTGILFVDEGQLRNLIQSDKAELMQLLLLMMMNSGIPIVLLGNEVAFDWITYSQDLSRLNAVAREIFSPIGAIPAMNDDEQSDIDADWESVATGVMNYYLLNCPINDPAGCSKILRECSGGNARLALILWCGSQRNALLSQRESIGPVDILQFYNSDAFDDLRPLAEGFQYRKPELLHQYPDVNVAYYCRKWGMPVFSEIMPTPSIDEPTAPPSSPSSSNSSKPKSSRSSNGKEQFEREQTSQENKKKARAEKTLALSEDDIRLKGLIDIQLAGFNKLNRMQAT